MQAGVTVIVEGVYCAGLRRTTTTIGSSASRTRRCGCVEVSNATGKPRPSAQWLDDWIPAEDRYIAGQRPDLAAQVVLASDGSDDDSAPVFRRVELSA